LGNTALGGVTDTLSGEEGTATETE